MRLFMNGLVYANGNYAPYVAWSPFPSPGSNGDDSVSSGPSLLFLSSSGDDSVFSCLWVFRACCCSSSCRRVISRARLRRLRLLQSLVSGQKASIPHKIPSKPADKALCPSIQPETAPHKPSGLNPNLVQTL
jgi:hypothetical protein